MRAERREADDFRLIFLSSTRVRARFFVSELITNDAERHNDARRQNIDRMSRIQILPKSARQGIFDFIGGFGSDAPAFRLSAPRSPLDPFPVVRFDLFNPCDT